MAEKPAKTAKPEQQVKKQPVEKEKRQPVQEDKNEVIVRIFSYDVPGSKNLYAGLTRIKGVSWTISNATCLALNMPRTKRISELSKQDIAHIEEYLKKLPLPDFLKNRRFDPESGQTHHLYGSDLDVAREFDIKRLKKIKSHRGIRHSYNQPTRGQRTRSHFRSRGKGVGVRRNAK
ncbi:30S ribosomal protein S13 [Candidatus Pacearchaeota archaeon]|nr:30S ribosomal protein S13 [Candidatus Pacearchaeota archaeon]